MDVIRLKKSQYSEWVIRQALYWLSANTAWTLDENKESWLVSCSSGDEHVLQELNRLLNDYLLREKLSKKTALHRESIISSVLKGIKERLAE